MFKVVDFLNGDFSEIFFFFGDDEKKREWCSGNSGNTRVRRRRIKPDRWKESRPLGAGELPELVILNETEQSRKRMQRKGDRR